LELYEKIYVKSAFLETDHGQIPCQQCHGGDPMDTNWQTAHRGLVKDPTSADPQAFCGDCHEEITATAPHSLHYTVAPFWSTIKARTSVGNPQTLQIVRQAVNRHCEQCHASCGQCHISRPDYAKGGFLAGHLFQKPSMETVCASCHGGRVFGEFTGAKADYKADIHFDKERMKCVNCHTAAELHADGRNANQRFQVAPRPNCKHCHLKSFDVKGGNRFHLQHGQDLACQVCHAQANKNCFNCHVGLDQKKLPYFKCQETRMQFKIGRNPLKSKDRHSAYVVVRHAPITPSIFDSYVKDALGRIDALPTWKLDTPHSIRRHTPQNQSCNACHGHANLFLREEDMAPWERKANRKVRVPDSNIPKFLKEE
jgi:Zn finger protein HypA/HybF involved in hydrogenase expression